MKVASRSSLPLAPLLRVYCDAGAPTAEERRQLPGLGPRFAAILDAEKHLLSAAFFEQATPAEFEATLAMFYSACVQPPLHEARLRRKSGILRHALAHLLHGTDPLPRKAERCLALDGPYHVAGLGLCFWSALLQALEPKQAPGCIPASLFGLERLGLLQAEETRPEVKYLLLLSVYEQIRREAPALDAQQIDHFLTLAGLLRGRDLWSATAHLSLARADLPTVVRQERARTPLRQRLKSRGHELAEARKQLEEGLRQQNGLLLGEALKVADPQSQRRAPVDWLGQGETLTLWLGRLWEADDPIARLDAFWRADPIPGAGLWLPAAVLHLRDPKKYPLWDEISRRGFALLDDAAAQDGPAERYRLFQEGAAWLCERQRLHPLELPALLAALPAEPETTDHRDFAGFTSDAFRFFDELTTNNTRDWMQRQRDRYGFSIREPLVELCRALVARYVEPVLRRQHGWDLETAARTGRALTSICKNDYGRSTPYHDGLWITFYRRDRGSKRDDVQFFVRLDATGLSYGLRLGREARLAGRQFRRNVQEQAEPLYRSLAATGALTDCRFGHGDDLRTATTPTNAGDLRAWAAGKTLAAGKHLPPGASLLRSDELVGDILLIFDRLLPAFACAIEENIEPFLSRKAGGTDSRFTEADFCRQTYLDAGWLRQARSLLDLKRQLILQGVPGTGKTHVARCLARLLTGGRNEAVRLVQFHPAYSYEEFVEGIKVKSVEINGRHDVTYPVEEGLLCTFAAQATASPAQPHVLLIDEINRGNLPRIFGELLYLLEYREQAVTLPYSKRSFRLPANLYLLGTMNAVDRSIAHLDQALRRRFSFLEMPPDADVLRTWLRLHPPAAGPAFAERVVELFRRVNARLAAELGPTQQVGHSYFMARDLDEERLRSLWRHQIQPLLAEYFAAQPGRAFTFEQVDGRESLAKT